MVAVLLVLLVLLRLGVQLLLLLLLLQVHILLLMVLCRGGGGHVLLVLLVLCRLRVVCNVLTVSGGRDGHGWHSVLSLRWRWRWGRGRCSTTCSCLLLREFVFQILYFRVDAVNISVAFSPRVCKDGVFKLNSPIMKLFLRGWVLHELHNASQKVKAVVRVVRAYYVVVIF